ncbi:hypothetical protein [Pseudoflavonifractor sp. MSJ-37]|uniref:hypothetical protein n=1 Tax=Pseudoflavonifractor sp. MSJ-37 TaxID=2841531 RepID=UPI001C0FC548|nr:hypothetical protein [Pseudoflavonifractor sp. MSJ-37]MBU5436017.1 hypothetical protein [Pseudoflavonifractor sp. MSJ-37]
MTGNVLNGILRRYGQTLTRESGGEGLVFLQPILERTEQEMPSPLGRRRTDRFLCLSGPELALRCGERVESRGERYRVCGGQPIQVGARTSHWWAILRPEDEEA